MELAFCIILSNIFLNDIDILFYYVIIIMIKNNFKKIANIYKKCWQIKNIYVKIVVVLV